MTAHDGKLEFKFHLVNMFLELFEEGKHACRLCEKVQDLLVLLIDSSLRDVANEGKVLLDAIEHVLWVEAR